MELDSAARRCSIAYDYTAGTTQQSAYQKPKKARLYIAVYCVYRVRASRGVGAAVPGGTGGARRR